MNKGKSIIKLENQIKKLNDLRDLNYKHKLFKDWINETKDLIEDLFTKNSRQYEYFLKIKYQPSISFFDEIEKYKSYYKNGLKDAQEYLKSSS